MDGKNVASYVQMLFEYRHSLCLDVVFSKVSEIFLAERILVASMHPNFRAMRRMTWFTTYQVRAVDTSHVLNLQMLLVTLGGGVRV